MHGEDPKSSGVQPPGGGLDRQDAGLIWQIAQAMIAVVELRDPFTARHQRRVAQLACALGASWGLGESYLFELRAAALVHDIGKIAIPLEILHRPGQLNSLEFNLLKNHPQLGYHTLKRLEVPWPVAEIVWQHHERLDGSGYPRGLAGPDLLLETKMLAVADVVEAMSSCTAYRPALGLGATLEEISRHKGTAYDPEVVEICLELFTRQGFKFQLP